MIASASHLADVQPYDPKYWPARIYLNANENPYGLPEPIAEALAAEVATLKVHRYPDPLAPALCDALAAALELSSEQILMGNGGDELLIDLWMAYGGPGRRVLSCPPTFSVYAYNALLTFTEIKELARTSVREDATVSPEAITYQLPTEALLVAARNKQTSIIVLASPNNPTGECVELAFVEELLQATSALVLLDQAYLEFADPRFDARDLLKRYSNLVILRTFSKAYALAGLRVGYLLAAPEVISELKKVRQPYSVNTLSARAALLALQHSELYQPLIAEIVAQREQLQAGLMACGIATAASQANFILIRSERAGQLWQRLYDEYGILLRDVSATPGLKDCLRVTVGTPEENSALLTAVAQLQKSVSAAGKPGSKAAPPEQVSNALGS